MSNEPENEPFIAPSADDQETNVKKAKAGRGLIVILSAFAIGAFLIYLTIILVAASRSVT